MLYDFSEDLLTEVVAPHIGERPDSLRLERCPTGKFNTTYYIEGARRPLVLRVAPADDPAEMLFYEYHMMHQEPGLHALVGTRTNVPCPAIVAFDTSHRRLDRDFLIMERLPGTPIAGRVARGSEELALILQQVGGLLRQIHQITGPSYGYAGEHRPMVPQEDWLSAFRIMWNKLIDDVERCGGYGPKESKLMRWLFEHHRSVFRRPMQPSLLHMDLWAQNILTDESGRVTGLIDWDRALWGDPELEYAVLDYCGMSEPAFWRGYGVKRRQTPEAEIRRKFYLLYEMQKYIFIHRVRAKDLASAELHRKHSLKVAHELVQKLKEEEAK
jgi:aminoglycoside phosphotransferase (APT) family kinase protein